MNKVDGNDSLALVHASHPVAEIYSLIALPVANANSTLNQTLYYSLLCLPNFVKSSSADDYTDRVRNLSSLVEQSYNSVIPEINKYDVTFNLMIVANLLNITGYEYAEAITNDTVIAVVEFRDGRAFTQQAERLLHILESSSRNYATIVKDLKIPIANIDQKMIEIVRQGY